MLKIKSDLQKLLNIGPGVERHLKEIGIKSKNDFISQEPFDIFDKMLKVNPVLPKPMLASLVGAKENVPWYLIYDEVISEYEKSHPNHVWLKYQK
ncbi:TfoX/Sxy family protein [Patescibacteria group bacterium]|nr:TfoX/Sxy family protein [Patescibacteria group bacterium]